MIESWVLVDLTLERTGMQRQRQGSKDRTSTSWRGYEASMAVVMVSEAAE